jgi:hypothetical protein
MKLLTFLDLLFLSLKMIPEQSILRIWASYVSQWWFGLSQLSILPQLPPKILLNSKVVKLT